MASRPAPLVVGAVAGLVVVHALAPEARLWAWVWPVAGGAAAALAERRADRAAGRGGLHASLIAGAASGAVLVVGVAAWGLASGAVSPEGLTYAYDDGRIVQGPALSLLALGALLAVGAAVGGGVLALPFGRD